MNTTATTYVPQPGDIYVMSGGYDQTNVNAFIVVRVSPSGKSVYIKPCGMRPVGEGHSTRLMPDANLPTGRWSHLHGDRVESDGTVRKVVQVPDYGDGEPLVRIWSHGSAWLWDGERTYYDTHAAGYTGH